MTLQLMMLWDNGVSFNLWRPRFRSPLNWAPGIFPVVMAGNMGNPAERQPGHRTGPNKPEVSNRTFDNSGNRVRPRGQSGHDRSFVSYIAVDHKDDSEPDPDGLTQEERYALEASAIQRIRSEESALNGTPFNNPGFDLEERGPDGRTIKWVEVKAMKKLWTTDQSEFLRHSLNGHGSIAKNFGCMSSRTQVSQKNRGWCVSKTPSAKRKLSHSTVAGFR